MKNDKYDVNDIAKFITEDPNVFADPKKDEDDEYEHGKEYASGSSGPATLPAPKTKPSNPPVEAPQPQRKPQRDPFAPLGPKQVPGKKPVPFEEPDKARSEGYRTRGKMMLESFREFTDRRTQAMWEKGHPDVSFTDHEMVKKHGARLAEKGFIDSNNLIDKTFPETADLPPDRKRAQIGQLTGNALQRMMALERPIKKQLEQIAIKAVSKLYGSPDNILKAILRQPQPDAQHNKFDDDGGDDKGPVQMTPEIQEQVNKRHMMNLLAQGSAIHNMHNGHFEEEVMDAVGRLSPELQQLYSAFGRGASHHYWIYDLNMMLGASIGQAMGVAKVRGNNVQAEAVCFPVLLQELVKGLMTLISRHQFNDRDMDESKEVIRIADTLANEFPQIQIGPKIWKELLSIIPAQHKSKLAHVVMHLASAHPKELHVIMMGLADNMTEGLPSKGTTTEQALVELLERSMREEESDENEAEHQEDYNDGDEEPNEDDQDLGDDDEEEGNESWR